MLVRHFIHKSLYDPVHGYFTKQASILSRPTSIPFTQLSSEAEFINVFAQSYAQQANTRHAQVWHTPTELFKPWFGFAVAEAILQKSNHLPLKIYEIGPGNGTLMTNILDYIQLHHPHVYDTVQYNAIEISPQLCQYQNHKHASKIQVFNQSILDWNTKEDAPCFVLAMEVIDNLSHDLLRFCCETKRPLQARVIESDQDYEEVYELATDNLILQYLDAHSRVNLGLTDPNHWTIRMQQRFPFAPNMTQKQFIPTQCLSLLQILKTYFPRHQLILSDFDKLPNAIEGMNGPVVQTMMDGQMIPCTTYLVKPGWFDIFFPTEFDHLRKLYQDQCTQEAKIQTFQEFMIQYGNLKETQLKSGENPVLSFYKNMSFLISK